MGRVKVNNTEEDFTKTMEDASNIDFADIDPVESNPIEIQKQEVSATKKTKSDYKPMSEMVNPLRAEKITIRHIFKKSGLFDNPKHVFAGGMADTSVKQFCTPVLASGSFVNVLTNDEKEYLEAALGLPINALSIYKKEDNYWANKYVRLTKEDSYLDLSNPEDYISYKILLANKDFIAPSLQALEDYPKATYEFVIINENDEINKSLKNMSIMQRCYKEFGKIEEDKEILKTIIELYTGKSLSDKVKIAYLQGQVNDIIQNDSKMFIKIATDELLKTKSIIRQALNAGFIVKRNNLLYMNNEPLCENGEDSTLNNAAKYLNSPRHQDAYISLQEKLK